MYGKVSSVLFLKVSVSADVTIITKVLFVLFNPQVVTADLVMSWRSDSTEWATMYSPGAWRLTEKGPNR